MINIDKLTPTDIEKLVGVKATGWNIAILIPPEEEKTGSILLPDSIRDDMKVIRCVGKVFSIGSECYKNKDSWCKLDDYIIFPRHAGVKYNVELDIKNKKESVEIFIIPEDAVNGVIIKSDKFNKITR